MDYSFAEKNLARSNSLYPEVTHSFLKQISQSIFVNKVMETLFQTKRETFELMPKMSFFPGLADALMSVRK